MSSHFVAAISTRRTLPNPTNRPRRSFDYGDRRARARARAVSAPEIGILLEPPDTGYVWRVVPAVFQEHLPTHRRDPPGTKGETKVRGRESQVSSTRPFVSDRSLNFASPGVLLYGNRTPLRQHGSSEAGYLPATSTTWSRCVAARRVASSRVAARANGVVCRVRGSRPVAEGHCC